MQEFARVFAKKLAKNTNACYNIITMFLWILIGIVTFIFITVFGGAYICFRIIFYSARTKQVDEYAIPKGEIYEPHREQMVDCMKKVRALPHTDVSITSFDNLTLRGKFFEYEKGAPIEIMFHGYRGDSIRDLSNGVFRAFALGRSVLLVDQRAHGESDGKVITFGIHERHDCTAWVNFVIKHIDSNAKIILTGVSMGAATVLLATAENLPKNVVGVLADCGYTSAKAVIQKVVRDLKLPTAIVYPLAKLGAKLFGKFNLEETSPIQAMQNCRLPVLFIHGDTDAFVPHAMSEQNYDACSAPKRLVTVRNAGHGLCYLIDSEKYLTALHEFFDPLL